MNLPQVSKVSELKPNAYYLAFHKHPACCDMDCRLWQWQTHIVPIPKFWESNSSFGETYFSSESAFTHFYLFGPVELPSNIESSAS